MESVYRNSYCNIAAADAEDSTGGLFRERDPQNVIAPLFAIAEGSTVFGSQKWRVLRGDLWEHGLLSKALYTRGWVYQGLYNQMPRLPCTNQTQKECLRPESCTSANIRSSGIARA
jgi:hypothetical protein